MNVQLNIDDLGYRWRGIYSTNLAYKERDVVFKDGGAFVIQGGSPQPFALGQQDALLGGKLLTGGVAVGGSWGMVLHSNGDGGVEFRFMNERNGTIATKLINTDIGGEYTGHRFGMGAIMNEGAVRMWGAQDNGQGGSGSQAINRIMPAQVAFPPGTPPITDMQSGYDCTFFIDASGGLWHTGANTNGCSGSNAERATPYKLNGTGDIPASAKIVKMVFGLGYYDYRTAACIDSTGKVYAWSATNRYSTLGYAGTSTVPKLVPFTATTPIKDMYLSGGYYPATYFLDTAGRMWTCGQAYLSGLNLDDQLPRLFMPWGESNTVKCIRANETVNSAIPADYYRRVAVVLDNGDLYMWGDDSGTVNGSWGTGTAIGTDIGPTNALFPYKCLTGVADCYTFAGGYSRSIVLMKDGTVKHSGYNGYGIGGGADHTTWTTIGGTYLTNVTKLRCKGGSYGTSCAALRSDGKMVIWGVNDAGQSGRADITDGSSLPHTGFVLLEKTIADFAVTGQGSTTPSNIAYHMLTTDGRVYTTGAPNGWANQDRQGNYRAVPNQIIF